MGASRRVLGGEWLLEETRLLPAPLKTQDPVRKCA